MTNSDRCLTKTQVPPRRSWGGAGLAAPMQQEHAHCKSKGTRCPSPPPRWPLALHNGSLGGQCPKLLWGVPSQEPLHEGSQGKRSGREDPHPPHKHYCLLVESHQRAGEWVQMSLHWTLPTPEVAIRALWAPEGLSLLTDSTQVWRVGGRPVLFLKSLQTLEIRTPFQEKPKP